MSTYDPICSFIINGAPSYDLPRTKTQINYEKPINSTKMDNLKNTNQLLITRHKSDIRIQGELEFMDFRNRNKSACEGNVYYL